jgi:hypothetical protein
MLAYIETRCVDASDGLGMLDPRRVRCNEHTHALLAANLPTSRWQDSYSTRLQGFFDLEGRDKPEVACAAGLQVLGHDDWDCLDDLAAAGMVEIVSLANPAVTITEYGSVVCGLVRAHKAAGGMFAGFVLADAQAKAASQAETSKSGVRAKP